MNDTKYPKTQVMLSLLSETLSPKDILSAKLMGQISAAITAERIHRNMSQSEFADLLKVKQSQVSRWESGDYNFTVNKLADISASLELDPCFSFKPLTQTKNSSQLQASSKIAHISDYREKTYKTNFSKAATEIMEG